MIRRPRRSTLFPYTTLFGSWMRRSGHFEFGRDRRPMNLGDGERVRAIQRAWAAGEEVRGWACYWDMVYGQDRKSTRLNSSHLVISYAVFCLKKKINRTGLLIAHGSRRRSDKYSTVIPICAVAT